MIVLPSKKEIEERQAERLKEHRKMEADQAEKAKKKAAYQAKSKAKWEKQAADHFKKHPRKPEPPTMFMNTKKVGPKASDWFKRIPVSELTEEDMEREVAYGFDKGK